MHESFKNLVLDDEVDFCRFGENSLGVLFFELYYKDGSLGFATQKDGIWVLG